MESKIENTIIIDGFMVPIIPLGSYEDGDPVDIIYRDAIEHEQRQNYSEAARLYDLAIRKGLHTNSMNRRAMMHIDGRGGNKNDIEAIRLLEQAIELGNSSAMYNRGLMHAEGLGGDINYPEAIRLYEAAYRLGFKPAHYNCQKLFAKLSKTEMLTTTTHRLLDLVWDELLAEKSFSPLTIQYLRQTKNILLKRLTGSQYRKNVLEEVSKKGHVITQILEENSETHQLLKSHIARINQAGFFNSQQICPFNLTDPLKFSH